MKISLCIILLLSGLYARTFAQDKKFSVGLEYSPNITDVTNEFFYNDAGSSFYLGHNAFIKGDYRLNKHFSLTLGIGYLNTKQGGNLFLNGQQDISLIQKRLSHDYLVIPVGIKYKLGPFFIHPEIGLAWKLGTFVRQTSFLTDGSIIEQTYKEVYTTDPYSKITTPMFLTIGTEMDFKGFSLLLGVKGYHSMSDISNLGFFPSHYYGAGMVAGIKF